MSEFECAKFFCTVVFVAICLVFFISSIGNMNRSFGQLIEIKELIIKQGAIK